MEHFNNDYEAFIKEALVFKDGLVYIRTDHLNSAHNNMFAASRNRPEIKIQEYRSEPPSKATKLTLYKGSRFDA